VEAEGRQQRDHSVRRAARDFGKRPFRRHDAADEAVEAAIRLFEFAAGHQAAERFAGDAGAHEIARTQQRRLFEESEGAPCLW
jgi:hypothetical protein